MTGNLPPVPLTTLYEYKQAKESFAVTIKNTRSHYGRNNPPAVEMVAVFGLSMCCGRVGERHVCMQCIHLYYRCRIYMCIPSILHTYTWQITHTHILVFDKTKCHNPSSELMTKHHSWIPHLLAAPKHMSSECDHRPSSRYLGCWKLLNSTNVGIVIVTYLLDLYARVKLVSGTVDCKGNHLLPDVPSQSYSQS